MSKVKANKAVPKGTRLKHVIQDGYEFKSPLEAYTWNEFKNIIFQYNMSLNILNYNQSSNTSGNAIAI